MSKEVNGYTIQPGAYLYDARLTGADLSGANLTNASLTGATLTGADLSGVISGNIIGTPSSLPTNWSLVNKYLIGPYANLTGANLAGAILTLRRCETGTVVAAIALLYDTQSVSYSLIFKII